MPCEEQVQLRLSLLRTEKFGVVDIVEVGTDSKTDDDRSKHFIKSGLFNLLWLIQRFLHKSNGWGCLQNYTIFFVWSLHFFCLPLSSSPRIFPEKSLPLRLRLKVRLLRRRIGTTEICCLILILK